MRDFDDFDDLGSEGEFRTFRQALLDLLRGRLPRPLRPPSEGLLWIASALLLGSNLLLILTVFGNLVGGLGPATPARILWVALGMDLLGAGLLAWIVWDSAWAIGGPPRRMRRAAAVLLFVWVGLTAIWRFALPAALGTNLEALFTSFLTGTITGSADVRGDLPVMYNLFGIWIAAATVFVAAHLLLAFARWTAAPDDWVRGLPVYAWLLGGGISLLATVFIVLSFLDVLAGRPLADNFNAWLVAKMIVAPNVFISGYASSLDLGRRIRSGRSETPRWRERPL